MHDCLAIENGQDIDDDQKQAARPVDGSFPNPCRHRTRRPGPLMATLERRLHQHDDATGSHGGSEVEVFPAMLVTQLHCHPRSCPGSVARP